MIMNIRNPIWADASHTMIDCEVQHETYGWIPFTAIPTDVEAHGRAIFANITAGACGPIAEYAPPLNPIPLVRQ